MMHTIRLFGVLAGTAAVVQGTPAPQGAPAPQEGVSDTTPYSGCDYVNRPIFCAQWLVGNGIGVIWPASGNDLRFVKGLLDVPNLDKYLLEYLDMRNYSTTPFLGGVPFGPAPLDCKKHELIIARATGELGKYGFIVGDPLLERVQKDLPDTQGYAVQYQAAFNDDDWKTGVKDVVNRLNTHSKRCPETRFALVGYSYGAVILHHAVVNPDLNQTILSQRVVGGVTFGDPEKLLREQIPLPRVGPLSIPKFPEAFRARVRNNCAVSWNMTDPSCDSDRLANDPLSSGFPMLAHFTYNNKGTSYMEDSTAHLVKLFNEHKG